MQLTAGAFHTDEGKKLFGAIGDSAPDQWGRKLMLRAERGQAQDKGKDPNTLGESDYLLGVNDEARQGALRFKDKVDGAFLQSCSESKIPPLLNLSKLLSVTESFLDEEETSEDIKILLAPGSSLGGARPKASVRDRDGHLCIAKFPRKDDDMNIVLWEAVALKLAEQAGITVSEWWLETILQKPVLVMRRFDRQDGGRVPFLSAMSMLGARDREPHSYTEIVDALSQNGANPNQDKRELWRRIVFSVMISNTDDHLRNHGFLYEMDRGWILSPAYDMNPVPHTVKGHFLTTAIQGDDFRASLDLALSVADYFNVSQYDAKIIIREVAQATAQWRDVARGVGLKKNEIDKMASAFEHAESQKAKAV